MRDDLGVKFFGGVSMLGRMDRTDFPDGDKRASKGTSSMPKRLEVLFRRQGRSKTDGVTGSGFCLATGEGSDSVSALAGVFSSGALNEAESFGDAPMDSASSEIDLCSLLRPELFGGVLSAGDFASFRRPVERLTGDFDFVGVVVASGWKVSAELRVASK